MKLKTALAALVTSLFGLYVRIILTNENFYFADEDSKILGKLRIGIDCVPGPFIALACDGKFKILHQRTNP